MTASRSRARSIFNNSLSGAARSAKGGSVYSRTCAPSKVIQRTSSGLTPLALAAAPVATEAKVPEIVSAAGTAMITEKSPYIVRTSFTLPQSAAPMAEWCLKNGIKKVVTLVTDYGPGIDAEKWFSQTFTKGGGVIAQQIRVPLKNPDFG